mmetsp:Transcript_29168/g.67637  ORF Transcript_29168/g.67637 Transcript_29168/m.67637 type:complete len:206 (-) Transcript_29168:489-1106(-)
MASSCILLVLPICNPPKSRWWRKHTMRWCSPIQKKPSFSNSYVLLRFPRSRVRIPPCRHAFRSFPMVKMSPNCSKPKRFFKRNWGPSRIRCIKSRPTRMPSTRPCGNSKKPKRLAAAAATAVVVAVVPVEVEEPEANTEHRHHRRLPMQETAQHPTRNRKQTQPIDDTPHHTTPHHNKRQILFSFAFLCLLLCGYVAFSPTSFLH